MATTMNNGNGALVTPTRNHYFYGKLMDVAQFEKEQRYFNHKRRLFNRLVLGSGVICGLKVVADPDAEGMLRIQPGLAFDGLGREVIVPETIAVNPRQLTDDQGTRVGEPINDGTVEICLAYAETKTDPVPVLVPDCDTPGNCAPSTIREGFCILVRLTDGDPPEPPTCQFVEEFPLPAHEALHKLLCERINAPCPEPLKDSCVPLARVTLDPNVPISDQGIDSCAGRSLVYSNALLYELILCLSERVDQLVRGWTLLADSGDGQTGSPGEPLEKRLVVKLVDREGNPVTERQIVEFKVVAGGGTVEPTITKTDDQGRADTQWTLGDEGEQRVIASIVGTAFSVTFRATVSA